MSKSNGAESTPPAQDAVEPTHSAFPDPAVSRDNLTEKTIRGGSLLSIAAAVQVVFQFVTVGILARLLSPDDFGVAAAALVIIELSQSIAQMGMRPAIVQRAELDQNDIRTAYTLSVILGLSLALAVFLLAGTIAGLLKTPAAEPMLQVLALVFVFQSQSAVAEGLAARQKRFGLLAVRRMLSYFLGYGVVGIACAVSGLGAWALVAAKLGDVVVTAILLSIGSPHSRRFMLHKASVKRLSNFGAGYTVNQITNTLANQSDYIVVARTLGAAPLGLYSRTYQIMRLPAQLIGNVVEDVAFPGFSSVQNEPARMARGFYRALVMMNLLLFLAAAGCFVLAPEIIAVALGPNWQQAAILLQMFALVIPFRSTQRLATTISFATGTNWPIAARQFVYFASVVLGAWFGARWGIEGVIVGVSLAITVQTILQFQLAASLTGLAARKILLAHVRPIPAALSFALPAYFVAATLRSIDLAPFIILVGASVTGALVLLAMIAVAPRVVLMAEGLAFVSTIAKKLPRKLGAPLSAWANRHVDL